MRRIILMVLYNIVFVPYWAWQLWYYGKHSDEISDERKLVLLKKITTHACRGGRITIEAHGQENIPKEPYILYPNHQGYFDVLAVVETCPDFFSVVMKKEVKDVPFLKQVFQIMKALPMDRQDIRQSMQVIMEVTKEVKQGHRYLIFAEGTRSPKPWELLDFKGGSFKAAQKAQCPIVPVVLIDSYKAFDTHSLKKITVQIHYLKPLYYNEYKNMKTNEIAEIVKNNIQKTLDKTIKKTIDKH